MENQAKAYCVRCRHELRTELCGFCILELCGVHLDRLLPAVDLAPLLRAIFVDHVSLRRPLIVRPAWL